MMTPDDKVNASKNAIAVQRAQRSIRENEKQTKDRKPKKPLPKGMGRPATGPLGWKLDYPPGYWGRSNEEKFSNRPKDA